MSLFKSLFGSKNKTAQPAESDNEHAVIVRFKYGLPGLGQLYELRDQLEEVITQNQLGEYDGHEIAMDLSDGFLYMYGPNAETLFKGIEKTLEDCDFMQGAVAKLRFGPPEDGVSEIKIRIGEA